VNKSIPKALSGASSDLTFELSQFHEIGLSALHFSERVGKLVSKYLLPAFVKLENWSFKWSFACFSMGLLSVLCYWGNLGKV